MSSSPRQTTLVISAAVVGVVLGSAVTSLESTAAIVMLFLFAASPCVFYMLNLNQGRILTSALVFDMGLIAGNCWRTTAWRVSHGFDDPVDWEFEFIVVLVAFALTTVSTLIICTLARKWE